MPWTTSAHLDGIYLKEAQRRISQAGLRSSAARLVPAGNLLIGTRVGVGKASVNLIDVAISQDLTAGIVRRDRFVPEFLAYYLASPRCQAIFGLQKRGATIKGIPREDLYEIAVAEPPPPEQRAIAGVLSKLQSAVELQDRLVATLKDLKAATMAKLFRESLRGEPLKQTEIGKIPESWQVVSLGDHCRITSGGTPSRQNAEYWGGTIPWVKTSEVNYRSIRETEEHITESGLVNSAARLLPRGTLLMAMYGQGVTRGRVAFLDIEAATNQACAALYPYDDLEPGFLYAYLCFAYQRIRELGHGANQLNLSGEIIRKIRIPLPPTTEEQRALYAVVGALDSALGVEERRRQIRSQVFQSMLGALVTGRVRMPASHQDR